MGLTFRILQKNKNRTCRSVFYLFTLACLLSPTKINAQELLDLLGQVGKGLAGNEGARLKLKIDSIDFQFAISVSENAGFFDPQNKGEYKAGFLADFKSANEKTLVERARDTLEFGLGQYGIRRYKKAEESFVKAKVLLEQGGLINHLVYLRVTSSLGLAYLVQGRWQEAEKFIAFSLERSESTLGKQSAAYIANLNNQAKLHQALGKYNEAEKEFEEALHLAEVVFGGSMQTAIIINNEAMLAQLLGRTEQAVSRMNEAINYSSKATKKIIEGQSFDNRRFQLNLGTLLLAQGKYPEAEKVLLEIKKGADQRKQTNNQEYGTLLNLMGVLYLQLGKNDLAEENLLKANEVYRRKFNNVNYLSAKVLNDLGNLYRTTGRNDDAEKKLLAALAMRESIYQPNHPDFVKTQEDLAILYWKTGQNEKAYPLYTEVMSKTMTFINEYFAPMSEAEKNKYWNITEARFQRFFNFALEARSQFPVLLTDFYDYHLATKALLLRATSKVRTDILNSSDKSLKEEYQHWMDLKEQLIEAYGYSKSKLKAQNIDIELLKQQTNKIERSLSVRSAGFANEYATGRVTASQITSQLGEGEAVVDFVRITKFNQTFLEDSRYAVFILKKNETPKLIMLEGGKEMDGSAFKLYRNSISKQMAESKSYQLFWAPIEKEVSQIKTLFVSLDGVYNQMNLNTLQNEAGEYLISKHDFILAGNAKDLIDFKKKTKNKTSSEATLVGFPNYGNGFPALPATEIELQSISKILKAKNFAITTYIQNEATEIKIKSVKSPAILHVASHGYFLPDTELNSGSTFGIQNENATQNPLLRSGLILTGASPEATQDISNTDNGFLTAYEVINLNLDKTDLVILSACETALGDVKSGEGVYGLHRAFSLAGAQVIVMSLWKVDDEATQKLMTYFYTNWTATGDYESAFKKAQLQLMETYPDPYFWGAFVIMSM